ncbi:IclR family transcriptional regulator [Arthrobacter sp. CAU 1506]|uniref:IclR family transcriptional regulator n=1 Tax=Arthrobacter sp. CAU 1506 TaxID=2560052 RepID=UPI0010AD55AA|nr:IclR family transcriptional regulator [Arthrobacter sp. CAU 1506]TJY71574.1 IclR family transcriptional regulator [Arthrobacter sp. CAU 1506]
MANSPSGDSMLDRLVRILSAFEPDKPAMNVATLSRRADVPLATTYRLVDELSRHGLLTKEGTGEIRLGLRLWELANRSSPAVDLRQAAMPFMEDIQSVVRQHTQLAVLRDDEVLVIERLSSRGSVVNQAQIAGRMPVHRTSMGMVLLANSPNHVQEAYLSRHPEAVTSADAVSFDLRRHLADIRKRGYAAFDGRIDVDTTGVAVPVAGPAGWPVAALGVVVPLGFENFNAVVPALMTAARGISRAMGVALP